MSVEEDIFLLQRWTNFNPIFNYTADSIMDDCWEHQWNKKCSSDIGCKAPYSWEDVVTFTKELHCGIYIKQENNSKIAQSVYDTMNTTSLENCYTIDINAAVTTKTENTQHGKWHSKRIGQKWTRLPLKGPNHAKSDITCFSRTSRLLTCF